MHRFNVEFFETSGGKQPAKEFLLSLDIKSRAKAADMISLLQENGPELREPYSKYLSDGIFELRIKTVSGSVRIIYFFYLNRTIILANGFIKKTRKTPPTEIEKAKRYRKEYVKQKDQIK